MKLDLERKTPTQPDDPLPSPNIHQQHSINSPEIMGAQFWSGKLRMDNNVIKDEHGRHVLLRGVNLTGNSKLPVTPLAAMQPGTPEFFDHRNVSFIGRPFTPKDAHEHFERLHKWGLTFTRLLVPWEALEHDGPGKYDEDYIESLITLLQIAPLYGIKCFIDPHQDTWSRFSGGSGAPGWTFEVAGLDLNHFEETGAAHFHDFEDQGMNAKMIWPTNYTKLASATMFTLFWGGNDFAPKAMYQGMSCQEFLQHHYVECYKHLAQRLKGLDAVIGFEAMNEPHYGYISVKNLVFDELKELRLSNSPTPLESFALGSGESMEVAYYRKSWPMPTTKAGTKLLNINRKSAWLPGSTCIWKEHGVWGYNAEGKPVLLNKDHFYYRPDGQVVDFRQHYYVPFLKRFATGIASVDPTLMFFFEPLPNEEPPKIINDQSGWHSNAVYAPHWYDLHSVFAKSFTGYLTHDVQGLSKGTRNIIQATYFGLSGARKNYSFQVSNVVKHGKRLLGDKPILIGECGIPMDINQKRAFMTGDYEHHTNFLDAVIRAMENNLVHFTLWNYNPHNDHIYGDYWNGEDFSIFTKSVAPSEASSMMDKVKEDNKSRPVPPKINEEIIVGSPDSVFDLVEECFDDEDNEHQGGRALDAVVRPYAAKTAGKPLSTLFILEKTAYELVFITPKRFDGYLTTQSRTTEIFVPNFHYGYSKKPQIVVSDGKWDFDIEKQTVSWVIDPAETTPVPNSPGTPKWFAAKKILMTDHLLEHYNFHTIQITPPPNPTKQSRTCNPQSLCTIL